LCIIYLMSEPPKPLRPYGTPSRGIGAGDVHRAADALLRDGERPTIEKVRAKLGTGSPNTINPLLDAWWKRLSQRLDAGPAALHRLPEAVALAAEALWMQALDEGRRRAAQEQASAGRAAASNQQRLEVRSHVLSLREGELEGRLRDRERERAALESQLRELTTLLRKEQATREFQAQQITQLQSELQRRARAASKPVRRPLDRDSEPKTGSSRVARRPQPAKSKTARKAQVKTGKSRRRRR
jgi:hypothetical protein